MPNIPRIFTKTARFRIIRYIDNPYAIPPEITRISMDSGYFLKTIKGIRRIVTRNYPRFGIQLELVLECLVMLTRLDLVHTFTVP